MDIAGITHQKKSTRRWTNACGEETWWECEANQVRVTLLGYVPSDFSAALYDRATLVSDQCDLYRMITVLHTMMWVHFCQTSGICMT